MRTTVTPILLALTLAMPLAGPLMAQDAASPRTITVAGEGRASATPDVVFIQIGVVEQADTAQEALTAMNGNAQTVLDRLTAAGIAPQDMQTGQLSLNPVYGASSLSGPSVITGFEAFTLLNVRIEEIAAIGTVLDAAVQDGANRLDGIRFSLANPEPVLNIARNDAVVQARAKAELFASAAGVTLGPLLTLTEQTGFDPGPMPMEMRMMASDGGAVPIAGGEVNLTATVTLVYSIE